MKKYLFILAAVSAALVACQKEASEVSPANVGTEKAVVSLSVKSPVSKDEPVFQTADEAQVNSIQAFVFNGNSLDAYDTATETEIAAGIMEVECTQGAREVWAVINAPSLKTITTLAELKTTISNLTADNRLAADGVKANFVMVGKESVTLGATGSATVKVDRIASRIRIFQVKRDMANETLKDVKFSIVRAYITNGVDNACYDVFTPTWPESFNWLSSLCAETPAIATGNKLVYNKLAQEAVLANGETFGTLYADDATATANYYVYPNSHDAIDTADPITFDQTKLVIETKFWLDGEDKDPSFFTYPIPIGAVSYNKTYDIKMLTITRLGNPSDGDDDVDDGEDDVIQPATATFTIQVNDWTQVLTFGGVTNGEITI